MCPRPRKMAPKRFLVVAVTAISLFTIVSVPLISMSAHNIAGFNGPSSITSKVNGLRLSARWTISAPGNGNADLQVVVELYNSRSYQTNLSTTDAWPIRTLSSGPCSNWPAGIALYYGNLSRASVPSARPLQWSQPGIYMCPIVYYVGAYIFNPMSNVAIAYPVYRPAAAMVMAFTINQTWTSGAAWPSPQPLQPGPYTLVVGDEWGQQLMFNFSIH